MSLISLKNISLAFGGPLILENVSLQIEQGQRVCLIGRNGAGKSTLLKILNDDIRPDSGEIIREKGAFSALLEQDVPRNTKGSVYDVALAGFEKAKFASRAEGSDWEIRHQVETVLTRLNLDPAADFELLSAGMKRRVLMARALASSPDILLLDEPTNHLDVDTIVWLEDFLLKHCPTIVFVTHDRMLLRRLATRIVDLDRGRLMDWTCDYDTFLQRRQELLAAETEQNIRFDKKMAQEEAWLVKGIRARRTRNEGRVRDLFRMREVRAQRRESVGQVRMEMQEADTSGKIVIEAKGVGFGYGQPVIKGFSTRILRGDRVGIIGPNGSGKSTLLKVLLGELQPQNGTVRHGTRLEICYYDQTREQLDEEKTVEDNVAEGNDFITVNGRRRHIVGYLKDFLFSPERAHTPVKALSGGERNRLLLARLFTRPSNLLVMDEPTNDLDAETLELLEDLLMEYSGTLLLVSHDREFLNNVVTSTLVFEGNGAVGEYVGGYDDWLLQRKPQEPEKRISRPKPSETKPKAVKPRKLTFKEKNELAALPARIEELEREQQELYEKMGDPSFYQNAGSEVAAARGRLDSLEQDIARAYRRWEELEAIGA